jgi:hypothetical protein
MDQTRLDAIRARCEAATPGPWNAIDKGNTVPSYAIRHFAVGEKCVNVASGISPKTGDADFIAHARTDVPDLLDEIERLTAALKLLESDRDAERKIRLDVEAEADAWQRRAEAAEPTVTLEQVRGVLADQSCAGHTDAVRALLYKHGAEKLSEIDPAAYPALLRDAEALGDG